MTERGSLLAEAAVALAIGGIVAAVVLPQAVHFWRVVRVDSEANTLVRDLRHLQEQSRSNAFRDAGLTDFYELPSALTMRFREDGWYVQRSVFDTVYRHELPRNVRLHLYNNGSYASSLSVDFGHNGGSVRNNTFLLYDTTEHGVCRYVIISGAGRIRVSSAPPAGEW